MGMATLIEMAERKVGRPKKTNKPEYVSVKIDVSVYNKVKTLAFLTGRDIAEVVSTACDKVVDPLLKAELRKQLKDSD